MFRSVVGFPTNLEIPNCWFFFACPDNSTPKPILLPCPQRVFQSLQQRTFRDGDSSHRWLAKCSKSRSWAEAGRLTPYRHLVGTSWLPSILRASEAAADRIVTGFPFALNKRLDRRVCNLQRKPESV